MKKILIIPALFFFIAVSAQSDWKQSLRYDIHVNLNPSDKSLDALMKLDYTNHSPDTLTFIWFHVWPNAYRNDRTLYSEQLLENGDTRFYFSSKDQKGYLNRLDFRVNGTLALLQDHPEYIDVVKLLLPKPLLPGDSIIIQSSFHLRLPFNFNGYGFNPHHFELRNWFPEPAVYDAHGWHPMPFLVQGGAYHEAADYNVEIKAPPAYRIAAGAAADTLTTTPELNAYLFKLKNANSFAWIADNKFKVKRDTMEISPGHQLSLQYFYRNDHSDDAGNLFGAVKSDIRQLCLLLSPYPGQTISIIQSEPLPDQNFSGLVCIGQQYFSTDSKIKLRKEILGLWFQTILMSDQRIQPWLSKGFMSYYNRRLVPEYKPHFAHHGSPLPDDLLLRIAEKEKTTQPISNTAPAFSRINDTLIPGTKAGLWVAALQDSIGIKRFDENMKKYFSKWQFHHPYTLHLEMAMDTNAGRNLKSNFDQLANSATISPVSLKRTLKLTWLFSYRNSAAYNYIGIAPVFGYNKYDGFMTGLVIHNINLPPNNFEFLFTPLYAFGSKRLEGLGRLSYSWYPDTKFRKISIGINGGRFASNKATDSLGRNLFESWSKIVPYIRIDFKPSSPRTTISKWIDFKTFLITEQSFEDFAVSSGDSLIHPNSVLSNFRYVNQLSFNLQNSRALYPYDLRIAFQQSEIFYRINLHANYFFNYPDGGGLNLRLFAAKFGVWNENNSARTSRYEPKLLGVTGDEDYLYQDYFIGRSASYAFENISVPNAGIAAQQIMNRDGGLKLRIDQYDYVQGKSANWVSSVNLSTSLPAKLFPFRLPIRIFFDIGTYAEAWQTNAPTSRFLYTGGIQLSLFKNLLNIYAPLIYSSDFNDALTGTDFGRRITFSIDVQNINYKKLIRRVAEL